MSEIFKFADLELDTTVFQVRKAGEPLAVQPQVFDVLRYLLVRRDRVVTKDELIQQVWQGRFISDTTLASRIKAVRQLVGDSGEAQRFIRTIRNRGYQFVGNVSVRMTDPREIVAPNEPATTAGITAIAVMPFETYGSAPDEDHFGPAVAADIIGLLARHHWLRVISRGSSFLYSRAGKSPKEIGRALGVRYLLMGRVRRADTRLVIDAELADCESAAHLWNRRFEGSTTDPLAAQEDIARNIAAAIAPELETIEGERGVAHPAGVDAWGCCHRGFLHFYRFNPDDFARSRDWFRQALQHDPEHAHAHAGIACVAVQMAFYGPPENRDSELADALASGRRAVEIDRWDAFNHFALGRALSLLQRFDEAREELELAIELNPSLAQAYFALGFSRTFSGDEKNAVALFEKAVALSPRDPHIWTFHHLRALAHFRLDELGDAETFVRKSVRVPNATYWPFATLCALLARLDRMDEAGAIADRLRQMKPGYNLAFARQDFFFAPRDGFVRMYVECLAKAGIADR